MYVLKMKLKVKTIEKTMKEGLHLVKITRCRYLKSTTGNLITNKNKEHGLEVMFTNLEGEKWTEIYWIGNKSLWRLKKLSRACSINGQSLNSKELLGSILWIAIGEVVFAEYGVPTGEFELEIFRYLRYFQGMDRPVILGDPIKNEGTCKGLFVRVYERYEEAPEPEEEETVGF